MINPIISLFLFGLINISFAQDTKNSMNEKQTLHSNIAVEAIKEKICGDWNWVIKREFVNKVTVLRDGTCLAVNVNVHGKWSISSDIQNVEFVWDNGFTDKMHFGKSLLVLVGKNSTNDEIIAAKIP